tara:strand:+ start:198 stop:707 length:510 start_codon:yes stop_codon:yes gene_type:complete
MNIKEINNMSEEIFINNFKNIFEESPSIAIFVEKNRPYSTKEHLINSFIDHFESLSLNNKKKIIKKHPDLGKKLKIQNNLTDMSKNEQKNAGLDTCTADEFLFFNKMNNEFKLKFDIPFIFAVKGSNKIKIIQEFKRRLINNDIGNEIEESIKQVKKIALFRLDELVYE